MPRNSQPNGAFAKVTCQSFTLQSPTGEPRLEMLATHAGLIMTCKAVKSPLPYSIILSLHEDDLELKVLHQKGQINLCFDAQGQIQVKDVPYETSRSSV